MNIDRIKTPALIIDEEAGTVYISDPKASIDVGAIAKGYKKAPYPQIDFLKEFRASGFGALITSDCHNKNFVDCHFDESCELLREAGFKSRFILTNNGFEEVAL